MKRTIAYRDYVQISEDVFKKVKKGCFVGDERREGSVLYDSQGPLIVKIAATHAGRLTLKNAIYQPREMFAAKDSFISPVFRPVLTSHDWHSDPIGRVKAVEYVPINHPFLAKDPLSLDKKSLNDVISYMDQLQVLRNPNFEGLGYLRLTLHINDEKAKQKFLDERYLSFSTGCTVEDHYCPICELNSLGDCDHVPGKVYEDSFCYSLVGRMSYMEVSVAHVPADELAKVESISEDSVDEVSPTSTQYLDELDFSIVVEDSVLKKKEENKMDEIDLDQIIEDPDAIYDQMALILDQMLADNEIEEDAKLSAAERKTLKANQFCGPNRSYPVPDCAHVTAAKRLLGKGKLSEATKAKISACVDRHAKSLNCGKSMDKAYLWLRDEAKDFIGRLSDFDLSELMNIVSDQAGTRDLGELPIMKSVQDTQVMQAANTSLQEVIDSQQNELQKITDGLKKAVSYTKGLMGLIGGSLQIQQVSDVFVADSNLSIEQCLDDLIRLTEDQNTKDSLEKFLSNPSGKVEIKAEEDQVVADNNIVVADTNEYKDSVLRTVIATYKQKQRDDGPYSAGVYLKKMKDYGQVPKDFTVKED